MRVALRALLVLGGLAAVLTRFGLMSPRFVDGDDAHIAAGVAATLRQGSFLAFPKYLPEQLPGYYALLTWLGREVAAGDVRRVPALQRQLSCVFGVLFVLTVGLLGTALYGRKAGLVAALLCVTAPVPLICSLYGNAAIVSAPLTCLAVVCALLAGRSESTAERAMLGAASLGVLAVAALIRADAALALPCVAFAGLGGLHLPARAIALRMGVVFCACTVLALVCRPAQHAMAELMRVWTLQGSTHRALSFCRNGLMICGPCVALGAVAGLTDGIRRRNAGDTRRVLLLSLWAAPFVAIYLPVCATPRYQLQLCPAVLVLAGTALVRGVPSLWERGTVPRLLLPVLRAGLTSHVWLPRGALGIPPTYNSASGPHPYTGLVGYFLHDFARDRFDEDASATVVHILTVPSAGRAAIVGDYDYGSAARFYMLAAGSWLSIGQGGPGYPLVRLGKMDAWEFGLPPLGPVDAAWLGDFDLILTEGTEFAELIEGALRRANRVGLQGPHDLSAEEAAVKCFVRPDLGVHPLRSVSPPGHPSSSAEDHRQPAVAVGERLKTNALAPASLPTPRAPGVPSRRAAATAVTRQARRWLQTAWPVRRSLVTARRETAAHELGGQMATSHTAYGPRARRRLADRQALPRHRPDRCRNA